MVRSSLRALAPIAIALALLGVDARAQILSTFHYPVGVSPFSIATGDLNGDGKLDLVTSDYYGDTLSVLLAQPAGGYAPASFYSVGFGPYQVVVADADGDGKLDLLSADYFNNHILWLRGNGVGGFASAILLFPGAGPAGLVVVDLNGDGKKDIVSANFDANTVSVMLGTGSASFSAPIAYPCGVGPNAILAADLNGDGKLDVATPNYGGGTISRLLGNGLGGFGAATTFAAGTLPFAIASGDVDSDGDVDLAVSDAGANQVKIWRNGGSGTFSLGTTLSFASPPTGLTLAQLSGDGKLDLAVAVEGPAPATQGEVDVFFGDGAGGFGTPQKALAGSDSTDVLAADLDGDGDLDLAVTNRVSNEVTVHRNFGGGVFVIPPTKLSFTPLGDPNDLVSGDFDDDGKLDLVASSDIWPQVSTFRGHGDGAFDLPQHVVIFSIQRGVALGDVNGDRKLDIVASCASANDLRTMKGNGLGAFEAPIPNAGGGAAIGRIAMGDLNGDGKPDLLVGHNGAAGLTVHAGNGAGGFSATPSTIPTAGGIVDVRVADMNGDGIADALASDGLRVSLYVGLGQGSFASPGQIAGCCTGARFAVGDLNGDGRSDVVAGGWSGTTVVSLLQANGTFWQFSSQILAQGGPVSPRLADLDGDGRLDLVATTDDSSADPVGLQVCLGDGLGGFGAPLSCAFQNSAIAFEIADADSDGRPDAILACQNLALNSHTEIITLRNLLGTPQGVAPFGAGTPGARGKLGVNASSAAKIGNAGFALGCTNAPRSAFGFALVGNVANVNGADTLGLGLLFHVDLFASTLLLSVDAKSDPEGDGRAPLPIPNVPSFVGATFKTQTIWLEKGANGQLTSDAFLGLVSSKGMSFTILP